MGWAVERSRSISWYFKGQNNRTEMYSALGAEVPLDDDPTTQLDTGLIAELAKHRNVVCCGEAKSHCVNWSVRHLLSGWPAGRAADIVVLEDGTSSVAGFEEQGDAFFRGHAHSRCDHLQSSRFCASGGATSQAHEVAF